MQRISLLNTAHDLVREALRPGGVAIDATVGNGHDTVFLVEQAGPSGKVFGFDVQQAAIDSTRAKVASRPGADCLTLIQASHAEMADKIPARHHGDIRAIMFNLGYLPGGDKSIITRADSTLTALAAAARMLSADGIVTLLAYPGHPGGDEETRQVKHWCERQDEGQFKISLVYSAEHKESAPRLFVIRKTRLPSLNP